VSRNLRLDREAMPLGPPRLAQPRKELALELQVLRRSALRRRLPRLGFEDGDDIARVEFPVVELPGSARQLHAVDPHAAAGARHDEGPEVVLGDPVDAFLVVVLDARAPEDDVEGVLGDAVVHVVGVDVAGEGGVVLAFFEVGALLLLVAAVVGDARGEVEVGRFDYGARDGVEAAEDGCGERE